ncbi:ankyrin repeat domain-containing protein [Wolbachia endosymbiont (group B) of Gerris lacustris]|uniref:ankyrin repeat domain-containing protein n=1 Tax=Wolbachia endosymbiont (group B) of Gerris lacustris TaxID=3066159 RepID=UPI00333F0E8F
MNKREQMELNKLLINSSQGVNIQQITELIEAGADVNAVTSSEEETPLHVAVRCDNGKLVELLLEKGANINAVGRRNRTPLHAAVRYNSHKELVELLLKKGAIVNAIDNLGMTPLHFALKYDNGKLVELLLEKGANISAVDRRGHTPLHMAVDYGCSEELVELLLEKGANVNAVDNIGITPLYFAARRGNREIVELLLNKGANISAVDRRGHTPLHMAVNYGYEELVELLLEKGANLNAVDKKGRTPLSIVANDYKTRYYNKIMLVGHIITYAMLATTKPECIVENSELSELWDYYQNEMMNIKLSNSTISLYQFLRETDEDKLAGYLSDKEYDEIRCSDVLEYISEFPEHTDTIVSQFDKAFDRRDLLDKSKAAIPSQNLDSPSAEQLQGARQVCS